MGTASYTQVAPDSTGDKIQTVQNTVGPDTIDTQCVVPVDSNGAEILNKSSSSPTTSVSNSVTSVQLLAANPARVGATFYNDDTAAYVYLKLGTTASTSSFAIKIAPGGYYELPRPVYTGRIDGIATAATGAMRITELS
jgi:hypothetical protein